MIVLVLLFIAIFEMTTGPVLWIYLAEIMHDKGLSVANGILWFLMLIVAFSTPFFIEATGPGNEGWIFIFYGAITFVGTLFLFIFMEETKDKTYHEIELSF